MTLLGALLAALALGVLPGLTLLRASLPDLPVLLQVSLSVPVSAGVLYAAGLWMTQVGVDVRWVLVIPVGAVIFFVGAIMKGRRAAGLHLTPACDSSAAAVLTGRHRWDGWVITGSAAIWTLVWLTAMGGMSALPPHDDGLNHGYFMGRISALWTLDQRALNTLDPLSHERAVAFYPMASHLESALVHLVSGLGVGSSFTLVTVIGTALSLPAGMLLLTRRLAPTRPMAGIVAAVLSVSLAGLSYGVSFSGMFPQMLGQAAVPVVALVAEMWVRRPRPATFAIAVLGLVGLLGIHSSAAATAVVAALVLTLTRSGEVSWARRGVAGLAWVATAFVMILPALADLVAVWNVSRTGSGDRVDPASVALSSLLILRDYLSGPAPIAFALLGWTSLAFLLRRRLMRPWVVFTVVIVLAFLAVYFVRIRPVMLLTSPWYSSPVRLASLLTFVLVPCVSLLIAEMSAAASTRRKSLTVATLAVLAIAAQGVPSGWRTVSANYKQYSVVTTADRGCFRWMATQLQPGERVLNGRADGSGWMYALNQLPAVTLIISGHGTPQADRNWLTDNADYQRDPQRTASLLQQLHVRFAFVGDRTYPDRDNALDMSALEASGHWRPAHTCGGANVLELMG